MKKCYKCGETKSLVEFNKDKRSRDGLQGRCRQCDRTRNNQYRATHIDKWVIRKSKYLSSSNGRFIALLCSAKIRAKKLKLPFELDAEWLQDQYDKQNKCCLLTGIELVFETNFGCKKGPHPFSPSLDRINPTEGYTKENTRLVCTLINMAMNKYGEQTFVEMATAYFSHHGTAVVPCSV